MLYRIMYSYITLHYITLYYNSINIILYCTILYYIILYYIILYYIILYYIILLQGRHDPLQAPPQQDRRLHHAPHEALRPPFIRDCPF